MVGYRIVKPLWWKEGELWIKVGDESRRAVDCSVQELAPVHLKYRHSDMEDEIEALGGIIQDKVGGSQFVREESTVDLDLDPEFVLAMASDLPVSLSWEKRAEEAIRIDDRAASELAASCED